MADVSIKYKGVEKATLNASGTKTIKTSGKYCEADVVVDYIKPTPTYRTAQNNLSHCSSNNSKTQIVDGEGYGAELTADEGYTFDGGTIQILMNNVDITNQVWLVDKEEY